MPRAIKCNLDPITCMRSSPKSNQTRAAELDFPLWFAKWTIKIMRAGFTFTVNCTWDLLAQFADAQTNTHKCETWFIADKHGFNALSLSFAAVILPSDDCFFCLNSPLNLFIMGTNQVMNNYTCNLENAVCTKAFTLWQEKNMKNKTVSWRGDCEKRIA
jgi:hypothetical protein